MNDELDFFSFLQGLKAIAFYRRKMHKNVFGAVRWGDETEALLVVEPFNLTSYFTSES